jgi:hypothetical protein
MSGSDIRVFFRIPHIAALMRATCWISGDQANWKLPNEFELSLPLKRGRIVVFHYAG